uniref:Uncharacterized protein n=1 Tax=Heterorhabditis bacteriophora TaxID=37862 RepID=A0A1I7WV20_HETBA
MKYIKSRTVSNMCQGNIGSPSIPKEKNTPGDKIPNQSLEKNMSEDYNENILMTLINLRCLNPFYSDGCKVKCVSWLSHWVNVCRHVWSWNERKITRKRRNQTPSTSPSLLFVV